MSRSIALATAGAALLFVQPAVAEAPPSDAMPLSEIIAALEEGEHDLAYFKEIEWDDRGYWDIEIRRSDGAKVEIEIDPMTGEPRRADAD